MKAEEETGPGVLSFPDAIYAAAFGPDTQRLQVAVGSLNLLSRGNWICLAETQGDSMQLAPVCRVAQPYPPTRLRWCPAGGATPRGFAASSDCLRLFRAGEQGGLALVAELRNTNIPEIAGPYTSLDWSLAQPELICCGSVDSTCTIWDAHALKKHRQVIAHEREVLDVCFAKTPFQFATVGADGTLNLFDTRDLNSCVQLLQTDQPLLRAEFNAAGRLLAVTALASHDVLVVDPRRPLQPLHTLRRHAAPVNALAWAPEAAALLCTAGDDRCALLWEVGGEAGALAPQMEYNSPAPLVGCAWSAAHPDCIGVVREQTFSVIKCPLGA